MAVNPDTLVVPEDEDSAALTVWQQRSVDGETVSDLRQAMRLPGAPPDQWDPRLPYELALEMGEPLDVFKKYDYSTDEATALLKRPAFAAQLRKYRDDIVAGGVSFKLKAKLQAEELLAHSYEIATDPEAPPTVRADLIKWTAAVADLGPTKDKGDGGVGAGGGGFVLNITFPPLPGTARPAIDVTPTTREITA